MTTTQGPYCPVHNPIPGVDPTQELRQAAEIGDPGAMYPLIEKNPHMFYDIDNTPCAETPIHVAVSSGNTQFAVELATLKPSLCRKLNSDGQSPMHLALQQNIHIDVVQALARSVDPDLIRVKGKSGLNVLHYAASKDTISEEFIDDLVKICPLAVQDLTIKLETPLHVAVKHLNLKAARAILKSLKGNQENRVIINKQNDEGNTALHIATHTNQIEVVKLLTCVPNKMDMVSGIRQIDIHAKNLKGLTAIDIAYQNKNQDVWIILYCSGAATWATLLEFPHWMRRLSLTRKVRSILTALYYKVALFQLYVLYSDAWTSEMQEALLVVATLIMTATYQASLSPPGGSWTPGDVAGTENNTASSGFAYPIHVDGTYKHHSQVHAGSAVMGKHRYSIFAGFNSLAFALAMAVVMIVLYHHPPINSLLTIALCCLFITFFIALNFALGTNISN